MKTKYILLVLVILAVSLTSAYAGNSRRMGTAGAVELLIPIGSRGTAMGGAVVANVSGLESVFWNPAGLASLEGTEVMFTHQPYLADVDVNFGGVATFIDGFGTIGLSAKVVSIGDMEETTEDFPNGTGRVFSPTLAVLGFSYAKVLTSNVSLGLTGMYIREDIFEVQASGMAFDIGFMYDPRWRGFTLGLAIKNYGPQMSFSGRGFDVDLEGRPGSAESKPFELPSSLNMGMAYDFLDDGPNLATASANFRSNNFSDDYYQGGVEYVYDGKYSLRAGYNYAEQDEWLYGASVGAGVKFALGNTDLAIEYCWTQTEVFDANQYWTLKANF
ncbi:MAG: PorV/PorQ family protein [candidate division Zixibacteria bacterium]|nr:PorV/PorQ family protein [candidate division Zixibacteria bacterium]MDH3939343.1 PorV/PorQ family protein [candidate division Zixibacteria bacterium]MDH4032363.1 PorV/PorQ family protein [candidate division Zixibacteria bacterium]